MSLLEKVQAVRQVFEALDREIDQFQNWSGLSCKFGCGKCCTKADIEATILEFLPLAFKIYKERRAQEWLERSLTDQDTICHMLNAKSGTRGLCSEYQERGLICRLFGYSARTNKYGRRELVTCQTIKTEQQEGFQRTMAQIEAGAPVPMMSHYYMQMLAIDDELARRFYPINIALQKAIESVVHYYAYREEESTTAEGIKD